MKLIIMILFILISTHVYGQIDKYPNQNTLADDAEFLAWDAATVNITMTNLKNQIQDSVEVETRLIVDSTLSTNAPALHAQSIDTVNFTYKNYLNGIYGASVAQSIVVTNYSSGWVSFMVYSLQPVTITIPGVSIDWVGDPNDTHPNFGIGEYIEISIKYLTSGLAKGYYAW